jgi:hypothetical protein
MGPRDTVDNWQAHISPAKLSNARCVLGFNHGVNDGLWVDYNINIVVTGTEEIMSFNDLHV